jgi:hypothetical protein
VVKCLNMGTRAWMKLRANEEFNSDYKLTVLDRLNINAFDKLTAGERIVNVGFLKCEVCRYTLDRPDDLYEVYDCGINGMNLPETDLICRHWSTCENHRDTVCNCNSNDSGCRHCEVCTRVEIVRVNDDILKLSPNLLYESNTVTQEPHTTYQWTDFDLCQLCRYPVCYAYEASFPYGATMYESSLMRLHYRIFTSAQQHLVAAVAVAVDG